MTDALDPQVGLDAAALDELERLHRAFVETHASWTDDQPHPPPVVAAAWDALIDAVARDIPGLLALAREGLARRGQISLLRTHLIALELEMEARHPRLGREIPGV